MDQATQRWTWWLSLLSPFAVVCTRPGGVRFVPWVTGMGLGWEAHPRTQLLTALGLEARWRVLEHVAADGAWDRDAVERHTLRLLEQERPAQWGQYHPVAIDDTTRHRTSKQVWGPCTFHEARARSPNRAETVRAHNWVEMGALMPGRPWNYRPHAARMSWRRSQMPAGEMFRTKTQRAVALLRQADAESSVPIVAVRDGAYAVNTVVGACLEPPAGQRRIEIVTRLRADARLYHSVGARLGGKGRPPKWGPRLAAPRQHLYWPVGWQRRRAGVYGRMRSFQYKQLRCRWAVGGPPIPGHVFVVTMAGDKEPWCRVATTLQLTATQGVEVCTARLRQADAFRDHKQRRGMEECRAWTKEPSLRTFQVQLVALTLLRLLQARLDHAWGEGTWWLKPAWNRRKCQASILDLRRLFWRHREEVSKVLLALKKWENVPQPPGWGRKLTGIAA